jgi:hypothetical protein
MRVRMLVGISGGRGDGTAWPPAGGELTVDVAEGTALCRGGLAVPVPVPDPVERAVAPDVDVEERAAKPAARARAAKPQENTGK